MDTEVRARKGRMLLFHNCHSQSTIRHPESLHGGLPVNSGEKWACNLWFREKAFQRSSLEVSDNTRASTPKKFKHVI
ncbi:MAG TPA: hypothetical protein DCM64_12835 [Gammaproteobacteria bacterium]|nr:hypothetical protein [Gammaproteobacteria bacterium]